MAHIPTDRYDPGAWNATCDRCGRKRKSTELRKTWDNLYVCEEHWEPRHPQDFVRSRVDQQAPDWIRPAPDCIMVADACPGITLEVVGFPIAGLPVTVRWTAFGVLKERIYTPTSTTAATFLPTTVHIAPGVTSGTFTVTWAAGGPTELSLLAPGGCESPTAVLEVGAGSSPVANFFGLVSSGSASYTTFNCFEPNAFPSEPLAPGAILSVYDAQRQFQVATGAGAPFTFESLSATSDGTLLTDFTDATSGVVVTVSATTGSIANVTPGDIDGGGRYSVPWTPDDVPTPTPSNGGSKLLVIQTNGAVVTFSFSEPMCGFGLYLTDYLDFGGTCTWRFFSGLTELNSIDIVPQDLDTNTLDPAVRDASVGFLGFVSNTTAAPFDRMTMTFSSTGVDRTGFDNIFVATLEGRPNLSITAGSTVQFTDASTGSPTSWLWNFGDSTTSTLQNPTKTYNTPGTFTVTLTVNGGDSEVKTGYITVS